MLAEGSHIVGRSSEAAGRVVSRAFVAFGLVVAMTIAGCSSNPNASPAPEPAAPVAWQVAVLVPLTGPAAASGRGALESVRRVLAERSPELAAAGLELSVLPADDKGQQSVGQQQATTLADDPSVIAVIGSTEGTVDEGVQPILGQAGLLTLSLGGAEPALTRSAKGGIRAFPDYVTLSAQRLDRARVAATLRSGSKGPATAMYGPRREDLAMAMTFSREYVRRGGQPPAMLEIASPTGDPEQDDLANRGARASLRSGAPNVVYIAADAAATWEAAKIVRDVRPRSAVIVDEDVLAEVPDDITEAAKQDATSSRRWGPTWATAGGATPIVVPQAFPQTPSPSPTSGVDDTDPEQSAADRDVAQSRFSIKGHDAAEAVVDALLRTWPEQERAAASSASPSPAADDEVASVSPALRAAVSVDVRSQRQEGLLGPYRFDTRGVATRRLVGVYRLLDGQWVAGTPREVVGTCARSGCAVRPL